MTDQAPALHQHIDGAGEFWQGTVNGIYVAALVQDPDLVLYPRGFATGKVVGAELVDDRGVQHAFSYRCW